MTEFDDMWASALMEDDTISSDNVLDLMREVCQSLKKASEGKVLARFKNIRMLPGLEFAVQFSKRASKITEDNEDGLSDANELYSPKRYSFDLYNEKYKFRIFDLTLSPIYPLDISFDEDIFTEVKDLLLVHAELKGTGCKVSVSNDEELKSCIQIAISSKKVRFIVKKMAEFPQDKS